jgi:hypothetical protein
MVMGGIVAWTSSDAVGAPPINSTGATSNASVVASGNANIAGAASNLGAMNGSVPAGNGSVNANVGGAVAVPPNGIGPPGAGFNGTNAANGVTTARPAPAVPNPAIYPNVFSNAGVNGNFSNFQPAQNGFQSNWNGGWMNYQSPRGAYNGVNPQSYGGQASGRFNGYWGRTFARGNPSYAGIRRFYGNGRSYYSGYRSW